MWLELVLGSCAEPSSVAACRWIRRVPVKRPTWAGVGASAVLEDPTALPELVAFSFLPPSVYMLVYIGLFSSSVFRYPYITTLRTVLLRELEPTR